MFPNSNSHLCVLPIQQLLQKRTVKRKNINNCFCNKKHNMSKKNFSHSFNITNKRTLFFRTPMECNFDFFWQLLHSVLLIVHLQNCFLGDFFS